MPVALSSIACHKNSSSAPTGPSSAPTGSVISIVIQGPSRIAPGETVQFTAFATFGDRTTRNYTKEVQWVAFPREVLTIRETGEAVALARGDAPPSTPASGRSWRGIASTPNSPTWWRSAD
jgi:hypothetical protein